MTGTLASTNGGYVDIATGINTSKIISVSILVVYNTSIIFPPLNTDGGFNYSWYILGSTVRIVNSAGDDVYILSQPFRLVIMYEE